MTEQSEKLAQAREDLCRFLAACYYEPSEDFRDEKVFKSILDHAKVIDPELATIARKLAPAFDAQDLQTLLVDYTKLFLGPVRPLAAPYGSAWLAADSALMQESTLAVIELYRQGGFDVDDEIRDLPDHVAVELEFLYALIFRENQARFSGKTEDVNTIAILRQNFLHDHLGRWVSDFAEAVQSNAETTFYQELAKLTQHFIRSETDTAMKAS